jgi:hypothetical protein
MSFWSKLIENFNPPPLSYLPTEGFGINAAMREQNRVDAPSSIQPPQPPRGACSNHDFLLPLRSGLVICTRCGYRT